MPTHHHTRHQPNLRLERWHRRAIYLMLILLYCSGAAWLAARFFLRSAGQFGETVHPLEPWAMKLHGAAAMGTLFFIGSLMNGHIRRALKSRRNLITGCLAIAVMALLIVSGYGLYYIAGEADRPLWSVVHWLPGLAFALLFIAHIWRGRASRLPPGA